MKIFLLNPPFVPKYSRNSRWAARCRGGAIYFPIWLSYATGLLEKEGHKVKLVDAPAWGWDTSKVLEDAKKFKPDMVVVESNFQSLTNDVKIAKAVKDETNALTVVVGPPVSQFPEKVLDLGADIAAKYEYDYTLKDIAEGNNLKDIKGISYKQDGSIIHNERREYLETEDLDSIPFVSEVYKKHLNIKDYFLGHTLYPMVQIITSRGCPNLCTFCSWPETLMGRKYRTRSVQNVVDELEYIKRNIPEVKEIFIEDDTFTINKKRVLDTCEEIKKRKLKLTWSCNARVTLDYETMKAMKKAGCRLLDVGYESGSDELLKNMKKGITTEQSRRFTKDAKKAGLMILADFIFGMPGETKQTAEQTIKFAKELKPNIAQFSVATPIPGTHFHNWVVENNALLVDDLEESLDKEGFQKCIISYPNFTKKDIEEHVDKALKQYYLTPYFIPIAAKNILRKDGMHELKGMMKSAKTFAGYMTRKK